MAEVDLKKVYIHDSADNDDFLALYWVDENEAHQSATEVRRYSGGRLRAVTKPGTQQILTFTFPYVTATELEDLRSRCGTLQMVRDTRGRKLWAVFYDVQASERRNDLHVTAMVTFTEVTYVEAV